MPKKFFNIIREICIYFFYFILNIFPLYLYYCVEHFLIHKLWSLKEAGAVMVVFYLAAATITLLKGDKEYKRLFVLPSLSLLAIAVLALFRIATSNPV